MTTRIFGAGLAAALLASATAAGAQEVDFSGQEIDIIVPFGVGGAVYVAAKFHEPFLERHLPGNPEINVVDRPGGGGILGANWFEQNADTDGTTLLFTTSSIAIPFVLGQEEVAYSLSDYRVMYSQPFSSVTYVSPSTGVTSHMDVHESDSPLVYGGIAAQATDLPGLLSYEVLDLDVNAVMGFNGRGPVRLAFEQGETNLDIQFTPVYLTQVKPQIEAGNAIPLWTGGSVDENGELTQRDNLEPSVPSVYEAHQDIFGEAPSGVEWDAFEAIASLTYAFGLTAYAHPDTPQEVIDTFAATMERINADPEFQERSAEVAAGARMAAGPQVERSVQSALRPPEDVRDYILTYLRDEHGVNF